jgi:demethylmenaquinone methyltransferase/2-methoxy-6-polyprenyl-1,4-benzoquinol methylase
VDTSKELKKDGHEGGPQGSWDVGEEFEVKSSMSQNPRVELVNRFFEGTGKSYDHLVNFSTLGLDWWWKKKILEKIPEGAVRIMDQACGTGILTLQIVHRFPDARVVGVELRDEYLKIAIEKARARKLSQVEFILGRAEDVLLQESFDCVTSSYLAKYAELGVLVPNIRKMLSAGGVLIMHDFTYPPPGSFARLWRSYFTLLQKVGSWIVPQWKTVFYELPAFLRETEWVAELARCLQENSFADIHVQSLTLGTSAIVTARKA